MADDAQPYDTVPSEGRQAVLKAAYQRNIQAGNPPYQAVAIRTRGELRWVMTTHGWSGKYASDPDQERANLSEADLDKANLSGMDLEGTNLSGALMHDTDLSGADLMRANLSGANAHGINLSRAELEGANLSRAVLFLANLSSAGLSGASLAGAYVSGANVSGASLEYANLFGAHLGAADLSGVNLENADLTGADLTGANLTGADLKYTNLSKADLTSAILSGAALDGADLTGADLRGCRLDIATQLADAKFDSFTRVADVLWDDAPLTRVVWEAVATLGDEKEARQATDKEGNPKDIATRIADYSAARRGYRQLAVALRNQGMNDEADHYGYCAQVMQREVYRFQGRRGWLFFWYFLDWLAGYGYKPQRTLIWYIGTLAASTVAYCVLAFTHTPGMMWWTHQMWVALFESFIASLTSLHGRGLFPGHTESHWQWLIAGVDAVLGLIIEASFVATFVQRFFAR